jgi:hypothetical protein
LCEQQGDESRQFGRPGKWKEGDRKGASKAGKIEYGSDSSSFVKHISELASRTTQKPRGTQRKDVSKRIIGRKWHRVSFNQLNKEFKGHESDQVSNSEAGGKPNQTLQ